MSGRRSALIEPLDSGYAVEFDTIDRDDWNALLLKFSDASFYQTWEFGALRWGQNNVGHVILKANGSVVAAVQLQVIPLPFLRTGVTYINWGPMWRLEGSQPNFTHLRNIVRALRTEYSSNRGYLLRILPKVIPGDVREEVCRVFVEEGFDWKPDPQQTVLLDLSPSLEDIRRKFSRNVRRSLAYAEKQNLEIADRNDDIGCSAALKIAQEMRSRKGIGGLTDQVQIADIHRALPEFLKLKLLVCSLEGEPVAALGWPTIGKVGFPLFGGTGNKALKLKASFLLWWRMISYYKLQGFHSCDLAAIDRKRNPGGYLFKRGFVGNDYEETEHYIGQFDSYRSRLFFLLVSMGQSLLPIIRRIRARYRRRSPLKASR